MERHLDVIRAKWTISKLLSRDFLFYSSIASTVSFWVLFFYFARVGAEQGRTLGNDNFLNIIFLLAIGTIIQGLFIFWWRFRIYSRIMSKGVEVPARMSALRFFGTNTGIEYIYSLNGQNYASTRDIGPHLVRRMKFEPGREVRLIVDPDKPKRFMILDVLR